MGHKALLMVAALITVGCSGASPPTTPSASPSPSQEPAVTVADLLAADPVVHPSGGESYVNPGLVASQDGTLHMLTNSFTAYPGTSFVSHLTSSDGISWRKAGGGPVLRNSEVPGAIETFTTAFVTAGYRDAGRWVVYGYTYEGEGSEGFIWRATAPSLGGPWKLDALPVLEPGAKGSWDAVRVAEPSVVRMDDGFAMFYTGVDDEGVARIGMATSGDGVSWRRRPDPVFSGGQGWDGGSVGDPQVVETTDGFVMAYRTESGGFGFGLARSADGISWEPSSVNPIMSEDRSPDGEPFWQSEATVIDGEVRWWLEVGFGSGTTDLYAYRLDLDAAW
jgi:predicted GH43/DUF377 family glycosyl hydrolase